MKGFPCKLLQSCFCETSLHENFHPFIILWQSGNWAQCITVWGKNVHTVSISTHWAKVLVLLHFILLPPPHFTCSLFLSLTDFLRQPMLSVLCGLTIFLSAVRQTELLFRCLLAPLCMWTCAECLTADIRMPAASCVSLFFLFCRQRLLVKWGEQSRKGAGGTKEQFPPQPLLTQIVRVHAYTQR